jgi:TonB family protein
VLGAEIAAQTTDANQEATSVVPVEVFKVPRIKSSPLLQYPLELRHKGKEGWVNVSLMVGPDGKPHELMVADSSGDIAFEEEALKTISKWDFIPATLNGSPIDSGIEVPLRFKLTGGGDGARSQFVKFYRQLFVAINANDRAAADAAMSKLEVDNLYEDAYLGFAQYGYANKWGTEAEQLAGLNRAIAYENEPNFLRKDQFISALTAVLPLQLRAQNFGEAIQTWEKLQKLGVDEKTLAAFKPTIDNIKVLRNDARAFSVVGELKDGQWYFKLYKKHFTIAVSEGHLAEVKLRCETTFVSFQFDPSLQYRIADKYGKCSIQLLGDPGTKFKLIQS